MNSLPRHPTLYEINTRVFLRRFDSPDRRAALRDVPAAYWEDLAEKGVHLVWLMGVWKTCPETIPKYALTPELIETYRRALPDWTPEDVIGSPYAIDDYLLDPALGTDEDVARLRDTLHGLGLRLILDFIPNHFSAESHLIRNHPEIFLQADEARAARDPRTFFQPGGSGPWFAHGRDPYYPAWTDTVQINYADPRARAFMTERLNAVAERCDGVRCDVAMLVLEDVFRQTWGESAGPFWPSAIDSVKSARPEFLFIAEAYWGREWNLLSQGFDYAYDKSLADILRKGGAGDLRRYLASTAGGQPRAVHFIENHDEERAVAAMGEAKSLAAAVVIGTLPGMRFFHDGQFEGRSVRLPVQLGREPREAVRENLRAFYDRLLTAMRDPVLSNGEWSPVEPFAFDTQDPSFGEVLSWIWRSEAGRRWVAINFSDRTARARIRLENDRLSNPVIVSDRLSGRSLRLPVDEIRTRGLAVELPPYESAVWEF